MSIKSKYKNFKEIYFPEFIQLHGDLMLQKKVIEVINKFKPTSIIETGTYVGNSTLFFINNFDSCVYTCEIQEDYYLKAKKKLENYNVEVYNIDSIGFLKMLIKRNVLGDKPFFFLDAHWGDKWDLDKEVRLITDNFKNCVILIDDFKVPNDRFNFDTYGIKECSMELIKPFLNKDRKYTFYYPNYDSDKAFSKSVPHHPSLTGYVFIFQKG